MNHIKTITLTGADEKTPLDKLVKLVNEHPSVEIGLLYTATPEGRNRYPSVDWLQHASETLKGRCAIHVCGNDARNQLVDGSIVKITRNAKRVQVNGRVTLDNLFWISRLVGTVITQHNEANASLLTASNVGNHQILIDSSGGRGVSPESWPILNTLKSVGRAGGIGPDNIQNEVRDFTESASFGAWIDMEGKLRNQDDWFDIQIAEKCVRIFEVETLKQAALV